MPRSRRRFFNQTLGTPSASDFNDDEADRIRQYNQAAAEQSIAREQARRAVVSNDRSTAEADYYKRRQTEALANALGANVAVPHKEIWDEKAQRYVSSNPAPQATWDEKTQRYIQPRMAKPSFEQLQGEFYSRSSEDQARIFQSGQAPFMSAEDGTKLLQGLAKKREESLNAQINSMGAQLAKGEITFNDADRAFYRTVTEPDPTNPLASTKKKVKLTALEAGLMKQGMDRGMLPDIGTGANTGTPPSAPTPPASVASPQAAKIASTLPADTATRLGTQINQGIGQVPSLLDRAATYGINAAAQVPNDAANALKSGVNLMTGTMNAINRFGNAVIGGSSASTQYPAIPYNRIPDETLSDLQMLDDTPRRLPRTSAPAIASSLAMSPASGIDDWMTY